MKKELTSRLSKGISLTLNDDKPDDLHPHTLKLQASPDDLYIDISEEHLDALYDILQQHYFHDDEAIDYKYMVTYVSKPGSYVIPNRVEFTRSCVIKSVGDVADMEGDLAQALKLKSAKDLNITGIVRLPV